MDDLFNTASSSLIAQRLANLLVGRAVRSPKFQVSSYDKSTSTPFVAVFPLSRQKLSNLYVAERALALLVHHMNEFHNYINSFGHLAQRSKFQDSFYAKLTTVFCVTVCPLP